MEERRTEWLAPEQEWAGCVCSGELQRRAPARLCASSFHRALTWPAFGSPLPTRCARTRRRWGRGAVQRRRGRRRCGGHCARWDRSTNKLTSAGSPSVSCAMAVDAPGGSTSWGGRASGGCDCIISRAERRWLTGIVDTVACAARLLASPSLPLLPPSNLSPSGRS